MSDTNDLELRILNGLHRGASLPLDDQPQLIGAADDADIVLVDPGIELRHAVLRLDGGCWSLLSLDGIVRGAAVDMPADQPQLAPGDCARVGRIWLTVTAPVALRVTHDPPCHQMHAQRIVSPPLAVLRAIPGLSLIPLEDADQCCGSAGIYNLVEPDTSDAVLAPKLARIAESGADWVATGNPGCMMQIGAGLLRSGSRARVVHPIELLDASYEHDS